MEGRATKTCLNCSTIASEDFSFCGYCGHKLVDAPREDRREVAVIFADVTGFTAICERLDPEEIHTLMNGCFVGLTQAIQTEEGCIDRYLGDAVMAIFGAPVAHEDDPVRACRAALAMQGFVEKFSEEWEAGTGVSLKIRIGIHCGLVVAGVLGSDARMVYGARGDTMNIAARLQGIAPPGGILVSNDVVNRIGRLFEYGPAQQVTAKGKSNPIEAYELLRELSEGEQDGINQQAVSFVGREAELRELLARWGTASRERQWIEIQGDIGLGKTRLVQEAVKRMSGRQVLAVVAPPHTRRRPFGLARLIVTSLIATVSPHANPLRTREEFSVAVLALGQALEPFIDVLWHLVAPAGPPVPAPDPDPRIVRLKLERGLTMLIRQLADVKPNLTLFIDSYERADEASRALLKSFGVTSGGWPITVIVTRRDGTGEALRKESVIRLSPLTEQETCELLQHLVPGTTLPAALRQELLKRASGVPLYLIEMVRGLSEQGLFSISEEGAQWKGVEMSVSAHLPPSIRAAMISRLDRLEPPARDLLCQASVQGVEFDLDVLEIVRRRMGIQELVAQRQLAMMQSRGFLTTVTEGSNRWSFLQPLMQEACYETLLLRHRRALHAETFKALCEVAGDADAVSPDLLAYHTEQAELWIDAATANLRAARRDEELFLNQEAIQWYERALKAVSRMHQATGHGAKIATLAHGGEAGVHLRVGAYGLAEEQAGEMRSVATDSADRAEADRLAAAARLHTGRVHEAEHLLTGALSLARENTAAYEVVTHILYDLAELCHRTGRAEEARRRLQECRAATSSGDARVMVKADMLEGKIFHTAGRFAEGITLYTRAYEAAERSGSLSDRAQASNNLGNAARDLGDYSAAEDHFRRALALWEQTGDTECMSGAHINLGNLAMSQGEFQMAREHHQQALAVCQEIGNIQGATLAQANLAILAVEEGDGPAAVGVAEKSLSTLSDSGNVFLRGLVQVVLGEAYLQCGDMKRAQEIFSRVMEEHSERVHSLAIAGAHRGMGRIALLQGSDSEAFSQLSHAKEIFVQFKRTQEEARTSLHLAEALARLGDRSRACSELEGAHKWFVSMHAKRDAERAARLLQEFSSGSPPT
jgi:class 3 adenylate cyclase/predicted ATPase